MIDEQNLNQLGAILMRIFSLPMTRTSFREVQSAIMGVSLGNQELFVDLLESFLAGQVKPVLKGKVDVEGLRQLINQFNVQVQVSREVHDRGQFITFITSDVLTQPNGVVFSNCIKTVEGNENRFLTDIESTMQLIQHFVGRIQEAKKIDSAKEHMENIKSGLEDLKKKVEQLTAE